MSNNMNLKLKTITVELDESLIIPLVGLLKDFHVNKSSYLLERVMKTKVVNKELAERIIKQTKISQGSMRY